MHDEKPKLFHEYLEYLINTSSIKQKDMAEELGYTSPNLITMFKQGKTRLPIHKVPEFAKILGVDPAFMLKRYMNEYEPDLLRVVEQYFGEMLTKNEKAIIHEIRRLSENSDPGLHSTRASQAIKVFVDELSLTNFN